MVAALFSRDAHLFIPGTASLSPWGSDRLHGGPVLGLLAHLVEQEVAQHGPAYTMTRFTADLFARVPNGPLDGHVEIIRAGRRVALLDVSLQASGKPVARASALFSVPGPGSYTVLDSTKPHGPESIVSRPLIGEHRRSKLPPGFHMEVETRFCDDTRGQGRSIWFRMPVPLLEATPCSPTVAAIALADFNNAVTSIAAYEDGRKVAHMNTDTTVYLERPPVGPWFAMRADAQSDANGISVGQTIHYDSEGRFGRSLQARLETQFG